MMASSIVFNDQTVICHPVWFMTPRDDTMLISGLRSGWYTGFSPGRPGFDPCLRHTGAGTYLNFSTYEQWLRGIFELLHNRECRRTYFSFSTYESELLHIREVSYSTYESELLHIRESATPHTRVSFSTYESELLHIRE
ncbi:hypothetical protein DPMN_021390 [Dreissena polymorpha]|uniref:Uncharacterized protein n=1 Tax=Dreissena polymorpha TaxID=45954 RepID=A0A9D4NMN2_DREPO|nr:hypothetical protein DPMN_021390 [Dreissena polymorpha]